MSFSDANQIVSLLEQDDSISDIHIISDNYVKYRKVGSIYDLQDQNKPTFHEVKEMLKIMLADYYQGREKLLEEKEIDFSYYSNAGVPYRINAYFSLRKISIAMRKIANKPRILTEIMYDDIASSVMNNVLNQKTGLFLVTGPTGSGKTTTLIAMLERLNHHRQEHIITIEDPVEFIFKPDNCHISQRELGADTTSFAQAMKSAMRQDPDIIMV
jgi:twitching motility protein PilT